MTLIDGSGDVRSSRDVRAIKIDVEILCLDRRCGTRD